MRAKQVSDYNALDTYPFCGHSAIMGKAEYEWQDTDFVLALFDSMLTTARSGYRQYVQDGIAMGRRKDILLGVV